MNPPITSLDRIIENNIPGGWHIVTNSNPVCGSVGGLLKQYVDVANDS